MAKRLQSILTREEEEPLRRAAASLFVVLWSRLNWPIPDRVIPAWTKRHSGALQDIGEELARLLDRPLIDEFSLSWKSPFEWRPRRIREDLLENQTILLLDFGSSSESLRDFLSELWPAFPRKIYILSVFGHD